MLSQNQIEQIHLITDSFKHFINMDFPFFSEPQQIYTGDFVLLSHNANQEPIFNFANLKAQELFEMNWQEFTQLPSKYSAEPLEQAERAKFLKETAKNGFVKNYNGIRISKSGKRFWINDAIIWNLIDKNKIFKGQAAFFSSWSFI